MASERNPRPGSTYEPRSSGRESAPSDPKQCQSRLTSAATIQGFNAQKMFRGILSPFGGMKVVRAKRDRMRGFSQ
jgi:hypothetical protein